MRPVVDGGNAFALRLYAKLSAGQGNVFFSPYSLYVALAMTYGGARGQTAEQMARTLCFPAQHPALGRAMARLLAQLMPCELGDTRMYQLVVANALWGQQGYPFQKGFEDLLTHHYGAVLKRVDFQQAPEAARQTINSWAAQQTHDKIKDLIAPGLLHSSARLVLTNAIYFKGNWAAQFSKGATADARFHLSAVQAATVPMMHRTGEYAYAEDDVVQVVALPYLGEDLSMVVLLPKTVDGLATLEKQLNSDQLSTWLGAMQSRRVDLSLPRFRTTGQFRLRDTLLAMGMADAFSPDAADFSGIAVPEKLWIDDVVHKAHVAVDEEGTEAAAATATVMRCLGGTAQQRPVIFRADHPFVFLIHHGATGAALFMGRVSDPRGV